MVVLKKAGDKEARADGMGSVQDDMMMSTDHQG